MAPPKVGSQTLAPASLVSTGIIDVDCPLHPALQPYDNLIKHFLLDSAVVTFDRLDLDRIAVDRLSRQKLTY